METFSSHNFFQLRKNVIVTVVTFFAAILLFICVLLGVGIKLGWFESKVNWRQS